MVAAFCLSVCPAARGAWSRWGESLPRCARRKTEGETLTPTRRGRCCAVGSAGPTRRRGTTRSTPCRPRSPRQGIQCAKIARHLHLLCCHRAEKNKLFRRIVGSRFQCACYSNGTRPSAVVGTVCSCLCSAGQYNGRTRTLALGRNHTTLVHFTPVIATQGGPENKGKLLCMPQYTTMTAETALSMCACGGTATVPLVHACSRVLSCIQLSCALYCWEVSVSTRHCRV